MRLRQDKAAAFRRGDDKEEPESIFRRHTESLTKAVLARAAIVISTCNNADTIPGGCFGPRLLVADECGQAIEVDVCVPLSRFADSLKSVVLGGDDEQLPPFVASDASNNEFYAQ